MARNTFWDLDDEAYWAEQIAIEESHMREATRKGPGADATDAEWDEYYYQCELMHDRNR